MSSKTHLNQAIASHLVEMKADSMPDRQVYIFEKGEHGEDILTYQKLHDNSNKIARMLLDNGVQEGDTFAVFMRNYPEFVYSLLAGTTIGAIMIPIDPRSRGERLKFFFKNSGAKAAIVSDECLEQLSEIIDDLKEVKLISVAYQSEHTIPVDSRFHALNETLEKDSWVKRGPEGLRCAPSHADHLYLGNHG